MIRPGKPIVRLQEQPARILEALTSRAGQLVTRAELQRLLWPEDSLVDADNGLNIAINKIRLALDDSVSHPRYIQTVPRRGYRFIGENLRGRYFWNLRTAQGMESAVRHLTRAIEMDRGYALAWAGLADVYAAGGDTPSVLFAAWPGPLEAGLRSAEEALRIDPSLGEAHAAVGRFRMAQWRWSDAERELSEAVRLSPNYATARQWYGTLLLRLQKCPAAVEQAAVGGEIDPITPIINEAVGATLAACGQPDRAILAYRKVLDMHPEFASTRMRLAGAHLRRGDPASALLEYREAARLRPNHCEIQARMTGALRAVGNLDEAHAIGTRVLTEVAAGRGSRYCAALVYANLGDVDGAFASLEAEVTAHGPVEGLLADFHLRPLHSDSRWPKLLERVGLTPYARSAAAR